jgi:hypothetical protein
LQEGDDAASGLVMPLRGDERERLERRQPHVALLCDPVRVLVEAPLVVEPQQHLVDGQGVLRLLRH